MNSQETQEQLKRADKMVHNFKEALDEHAIVAITDAQGKIIYANDKSCDISQYQEDELIGQDHKILNSGLHSDDFFGNLWQTITQTKVWRGEIRNCRKDGSFYWVDTTIVPFLKDDGEPEQYMAIGADITKLKESNDRLDHISKMINEVFWMMNAEGEKILYVSPAFEKIWGKPLEALYADASIWNDAVIDEDLSKVYRNFERLKDGYESEFDIVYRIRDQLGELHWIQDRGYASRDKDGLVEYLVGVASDISVRKTFESQALVASEKERIRIGQELHDDLCQYLAALKIKCGIVCKALVKESSSQLDLMTEIEAQMEKVTNLTRTIAKGLSPVILESEGLMVALGRLAETTEGRFTISCHFDCPEPVEVDDPTKASHIFRIAQELVTNAAKHAVPKRIILGLYNGLGGVRLEVINDGRPFSGPSKKNVGMGLHFVQFRADSIGAAIDYCPSKAPDGGTRVICMVPHIKRGLRL